MYQIEISDEAEIDFTEIYDYYLQKAGQSIANGFINDFEAALNSLKTVVFFEVIYNEFRRLPLKYPFILIYKVDQKKQIIRIYRIFHTSQNPEKYPK